MSTIKLISARGSEPTQIVQSCKTSSSPSDDLGFFIALAWVIPAGFAVWGIVVWCLL
jgi:hypothetical protein